MVMSRNASKFQWAAVLLVVIAAGVRLDDDPAQQAKAPPQQAAQASPQQVAPQQAATQQAAPGAVQAPQMGRPAIEQEVAAAEAAQAKSPVGINDGIYPTGNTHIMINDPTTARSLELEATADIMKEEMTNQSKRTKQVADDAEARLKKSDADTTKAKKHASDCENKEKGAIKTAEEALKSEKKAIKEKEEAHQTYASALANYKIADKILNETFNNKTDAHKKLKEANAQMAKDQEVMQKAVAEAAKYDDLEREATQTYNKAKNQTDEISIEARRVSANKIAIEKIAGDTKAAASEVSHQHKELSDKVLQVTDEKRKADGAASQGITLANAAAAQSAVATGLAFGLLNKKVGADKEAKHNVEINNMVKANLENSKKAAEAEASQSSGSSDSQGSSETAASQ